MKGNIYGANVDDFPDAHHPDSRKHMATCGHWIWMDTQSQYLLDNAEGEVATWCTRCKTPLAVQEAGAERGLMTGPGAYDYLVGKYGKEKVDDLFEKFNIHEMTPEEYDKVVGQ